MSRYAGLKPSTIEMAMRELSRHEILEAHVNAGYCDDMEIKSATFLNTYYSQMHRGVCYRYLVVYWDDNEGDWDKGFIHVWRNNETGDLQADF